MLPHLPKKMFPEAGIPVQILCSGYFLKWLCSDLIEFGLVGRWPISHFMKYEYFTQIWVFKILIRRLAVIDMCENPQQSGPRASRRVSAVLHFLAVPDNSNPTHQKTNSSSFPQNSFSSWFSYYCIQQFFRCILNLSFSSSLVTKFVDYYLTLPCKYISSCQ